MRVVITGASSGIGEALCREIATRFPGADLLLIARRAEPMRALANSLAGVQCQIAAIDVCDRPALQATLDAFSKAGAPDLVIANAGISEGLSISSEPDRAVYGRIIDVNLIALIDTLGACIDPMRQRGCGKLVGIASVAGVRGVPGASAYSASKAAVIASLESLRVELRGTGIDVVTIAPGFVRTPMTEANPWPMPFLMSSEAFARRALDAIAAGRRFAVIPWPMAIVAFVLSMMPAALYDRLMSAAPRKPRKDRGSD